MNAIKHFLDLILAIILMFLVVGVNYSQKQDVLSQLYIEIKTKEFTDNVRVHGYMTIQMYEKFKEELSTTGIFFEVEITQERMIFEPEYNNQVFSGNVMVYTEVKYTEEILANMNNNNVYKFTKNDYIEVTVKSNSLTLGMSVFNKLFGAKYQCIAVSSGKIRDVLQEGI